MTGDSSTAAELVVLIIGLAIYFLPTAIAINRGHMSKGAIFALNLLLGWIGIGWIVALIWSLTGNIRRNFMLLQPAKAVEPPTEPIKAAKPAIDGYRRAPGLSPAAATVATVILALAGFALAAVVVQNWHTPASTASASLAPQDRSPECREIWLRGGEMPSSCFGPPAK